MECHLNRGRRRRPRSRPRRPRPAASRRPSRSRRSAGRGTGRGDRGRRGFRSRSARRPRPPCVYAAGLELALDEDEPALGGVLLQALDEPLLEGDGAVPLDPVDPLAGLPAEVALVGGDGEVRDPAAASELVDLGVASEAADELDVVLAECHGGSPGCWRWFGASGGALLRTRPRSPPLPSSSLPRDEGRVPPRRPGPATRAPPRKGARARRGVRRSGRAGCAWRGALREGRVGRRGAGRTPSRRSLASPVAAQAVLRARATGARARRTRRIPRRRRRGGRGRGPRPSRARRRAGR